jgi:hypothetical protein
MGDIIVSSLAILSKGLNSEYIVRSPSLSVSQICTFPVYTRQQREQKNNTLTGKNQGQQIGPFFRQDRRADQFPSPHHCRLLLPRKVLAFVHPSHPCCLQKAANGKEKGYGRLVEHSYSDCQKAGRLAANNANTTIMTIQLNTHNQSTLAPRINTSVANMATEASKPLINGTGPKSSMTEPIQFSMALPNAPGSRIHTHLTILATSILLFCTSTTAEFSTASVPTLGSFVYAMPDVCTDQTSYS